MCYHNVVIRKNTPEECVRGKYKPADKRYGSAHRDLLYYFSVQGECFHN